MKNNDPIYLFFIWIIFPEKNNPIHVSCLEFIIRFKAHTLPVSPSGWQYLESYT